MSRRTLGGIVPATALLCAAGLSLLTSGRCPAQAPTQNFYPTVPAYTGGSWTLNGAQQQDESLSQTTGSYGEYGAPGSGGTTDTNQSHNCTSTPAAPEADFT